MTGYTPQGIPYPEPNDLVGRTDDIMRDMEAVIRVRTGAKPIQVWVGAVTSSLGGDFDHDFSATLARADGAIGITLNCGGSVQLMFQGESRPGVPAMRAINPVNGGVWTQRYIEVVFITWGQPK